MIPIDGAATPDHLRQSIDVLLQCIIAHLGLQHINLVLAQGDQPMQVNYMG